MKRPCELYPVEPWMLPYFAMFQNTGGNDVVELLHDEDTDSFSNVIRYMLIVSVRSQYTFLMRLHRGGWLDLDEGDSEEVSE